jgi:RNA polymerase sigma factor (sigma-70 family)
MLSGSCRSSRSRGETEGRDTVTALVTGAAGGNALATEALIQRYAGLVWSIAWSYRLSPADAADVSQVVWLRLVENIGRIRQPDAVGAWLASVARHECLRTLRRAEREVATADGLNVEERSDDGDVDLGILEGERGVALRQAFEGLPPRWRALLEMLLDVPTASYEEVAAAVGMPIGSIGPTRQRCLERLRSSPALVELTAA